MKTLRAIIVDDEPLAHKVILKYAEDLPDLEIVAQCYLATEVYKILNEEQIDLIFLDINMPKLKGLDFLRSLAERPEVIITSAYEEYALEGFELQVTDYLLKPFRFDRFVKAVNNVKARMASVTEIDDSPIFIKVDKKQIRIDPSDIRFIESYGNYIKIYIDKSVYLTARTLSSFAVELPDQFMRVHKSYVVNKSYIDFVEGNQIRLKSGEKVGVGKSYRAIVKEMFN